MNWVEGVGNEVVLGVGALMVAAVLVIYLLFQRPRRNIHPQQEVSVTATRRELLGQRGTVGDSAEPDNCCICLSRLAFPVDTNCGHTFCAECILSYWNHDQWPQPARCAVCRSQITLLLPCAALSDTINSDLWNRVVDYNHRMSGQPRSLLQYLCDVPVIISHVWRLLFTAEGVALLYRLHILLLLFLFALYLLSPLDLIPEAIFGIVGLLDDIVILVAIVTYVALLYQHHITHR